MGQLQKIAEERGIENLRKLAVQIWERQPTKGITLEALANKVRDLDKGKDLAWWRKAGERYQQPLAKVLELEFDELLALLERGESQLPRRWRFDQLQLEPLDLEREELFPGIPPDLTRARGPASQLTWWHAPPGAGKSVVGRWLAVRFDWVVLSARSWADLEERIPATGDVYVELESGHVPHAVRAMKERRGRLCVACIVPPSGALEPPGQTGEPTRSPRRDGVQDWAIVAPPPSQEWFTPLIDWVADRIEEGGGFHRHQVHELVAQLHLRDVLATPGELIDFLGVVDRIGVPKLREGLGSSRDPMSLVRTWWRLACERKDRDAALKLVPSLPRQGVELLRQAEERRLQHLLPSKLSASEWKGLFDDPAPSPIDPSQLVEILRLPDGKEKALDLLEGTKRDTVSAFRTMGALREEADQRLSIHPSWIARILHAVAVDHLAEETSTLGALLLHPETAAVVLRGMWAEVQDGQLERVQRCLRPGGENPAAEELAAVSGAFLAVGLAVAVNAAVPIEVVRAAWRRQAPYLASRYQNSAITTPLLSATVSREDRGITSRGAWILAAVAIVHRLAEEATLDTEIAEPWNALLDHGPHPPNSPAHQLLRGALDDAAHDLTSPGAEEEIRQLPYLLGEQLLARHGFIQGLFGTVRGQQPARLVLLSQGKIDVPAHEKEELLRLPWGLDALEQSCRRLSASCDDVLRWCWQTWGEPHRAGWNWPPMRTRTESAAWVQRIWSLAPASLLSIDSLKALENVPAAWPSLRDDVWRRWIALFDADASTHLEILKQLPTSIAIELLRSGRIVPTDHSAREILWSRLPTELLAFIDELAIAPPPPHTSPLLPALVFSVPEPYVEQVLARAEQWRAAPASHPGVTDWLGRWLMHVVERRLPGWRRALAMAIAKAATLH